MCNLKEITLNNCDKEPIHIPGKIQAHGFILICDIKNLDIVQLSENIKDFINIDYKEIINRNLNKILDIEIIKSIKESIKIEDFSSFNPHIFSYKTNNFENKFNIICTLSQGLLILEFEPFFDNQNSNVKFYNLFNKSINKIQSSKSLKELFQITAEQIKILTNYDRVMVYKFDKDWNGEVVGEAKNANLETYLGLNYPHTDIPKQARDLYLKNWVRLIVDLNNKQPLIYPEINIITNKPLDLSNNILRATSPIHIEYLQNMGVCATLTISIIFNNKLWGLFACHNYSAKFIDYDLRMNCELLGKIFSNQLKLQEENEDSKNKEILNNNLNLLIEDMSKEWSIVDPLKKDILNINYSDSAIIFYDEKINRINNSIEDKYIKKIINYIKNLNQNILVTDEVSKIIPECIDIKDNASGLMALSLSSNNYILWFKKEHIKTIDWAGKPDEKNISIENDLIRLSPRKSFEKWSESKSNKSKEWKNIEINIALKLRENIVTIILKNITILKEINRELELQRELLQSKNNELLNFASVASHDLKEPLRMVTSYNQLLLRKYKDKLDESGIEFLQYSIDGAERMRKLIESLLKYAKIGTESKEFSEIDINNVLNRVLKNLRLIIEEKSVNIKFDNMPKVIGDSTLLEVLFQNLISNSIKYNKNNPEINILCNEDKEEYIFSIKDNGIGISSDYHEAIFSMFKRLHSRSDYEGTGIGLATVKKIVEHHKGRIWLESEDEKGTVFYFTLSKNLN